MQIRSHIARSLVELGIAAVVVVVVTLAVHGQLDPDATDLPGPAAAPPVVRGRVVDVLGMPVAGASVGLSVGDSDFGDVANVGVGDAAPMGGGHVVFTDDTGAFAQLTTAGCQWLVVSAEGFATQEVRVWSPSYEGDVMVVLRPGTVLRGRALMGATSAPVVGASVYPGLQRAERWQAAPLRQALLAPVATDAEGRFVLSGLEPGLYRPIVVGDGVYCEANTTLTLELTDNVGELPIDCAGTSGDLAGSGTFVAAVKRRVVVDDGKPCPGARVRLRSHLVATAVDVNAGEDGGVILANLLPSVYQAVIDCPGHRSRTVTQRLLPTLAAGNGEEDVVWQAGEIATKEIESGPTAAGAGSLHGRVRTRLGEPIGGLDVFIVGAGVVTDPQEPREVFDTTDGGGHFWMPLEPGVYEITVVHPIGGMADRGWLVGAGQWQVEVRANEQSEHDFELEGLVGEISGLVVGADGQPVGGVGGVGGVGVVTPIFVGYPRTARALQVHPQWQQPIDAMGRFSLRGLIPGDYDLRVEYSSGAVGFVHGVTTQDTVTIELEATGSLSGRLALADLRSTVGPRGDVTITANEWQRGLRRFAHIHQQWPSGGGEVMGGGKMGEESVAFVPTPVPWRFDNLPAGVWEITAESAEALGSLLATVDAGEHSRDLEVVMRSESDATPH